MALKLMYITNNPKLAFDIDKIGVDRIFLDLEIIGKEERQGHLDTVISRHSIDDIPKLRKQVNNGELLVRCNPIYSESKKEIDTIINNGADIIMLPFFKTTDEVKKFIEYVGGRAKTNLLFETPEAAEIADDILNLGGIDEVHIGLNDLHLGYGLNFMFELLTNGVVEYLCNIFKKHSIPFGIGGVARLKNGTLPAEYIIAEHYRLGSQCAILSRSFCNPKSFDEYEDFIENFKIGFNDIRHFESCLKEANDEFFIENKKKIDIKVRNIVSQIKNKA